jgi:hypothetical protein
MIIRRKKKQSLVHKVPSEVAILSHVCGVVIIIHPFRVWCLCLANAGRQGILVFYQWKIRMGIAT